MANYVDIRVYRLGALEDATEHNGTIRTIFVAYDYIGAVESDGLLGYLYGHSGSNAFQLAASLREVGAHTSAEIAEKALAMFPEGVPAKEMEERCAQIAQIVETTGSQDPWEHLNRDFIEDLPNLEMRLSAFVHKHEALIESFPEDNDQKQMMAGVMMKMKRR